MGIGDSNEMGQNQRRPGFLRWGEGARGADADASAENPAPVTPDEEPTAAAAADGTSEAATEAEPASTEPPAGPSTAAGGGNDESPFLRDLVGAMRGVAESSRDTTVAEFRQSVEARIEELKAAAAERAGDLRRRSELDLGGIGDWERSELERVRAEAEQRRKARRELLEKELAEHDAAGERELEALRARLDDYEREMDGFFAKLGDITDPGAFVAAAKRMPPPPDLATPGSAKAAPTPAPAPDASNGNGTTAPAEDRLAQRLAQLDERLGAATAEAATAQAAADAPADAAVPAPTHESPAADAAGTTDEPAHEAAAATAASSSPTATATAAPPSGAETSTPIVVKGLGSFGAITSFKQALERVDGIRGVTLSLGPTGDFVYRASHAGDFDLVSAIRSIEGPNAGIEEVEGQLRVTIERPR
jgi:hypothetical protein